MAVVSGGVPATWCFVALIGGGFVACSTQSHQPPVEVGGTAGKAGLGGAGAGGGAIDAAGASDTAAVDAVDAGDAEDVNPCVVSEGGAGGSADGATDATGFTGPFECTLVAGILPTREWFTSGFESDCLDGTKWEGKFQHYGYIGIWAEDPLPNGGGFAWNAAIESPCARNSDAPDRVIFTAWDWELSYEEDEFVSTTVRAVDKFIQNYPSMKRMDLMTIIRCPGDPVTLPSGKMCNPNAKVPPVRNNTNKNAGQQDCYVPPTVDSALARVAAQFPGLVFVAPKFYSPACRVPVDGPHLGRDNNVQVARDIAAYYRSNP